jgi:hypothetical protein
MAVGSGFRVTVVTATKSKIPFLGDLRREGHSRLASHIIDDLVAPTGQ